MADLEINVKEIKQKIAPRYTDGVAGNDLNTLLLMHFDEETATWVDSSFGGVNSPQALTIDNQGATIELVPSLDSKFNKGSLLVNGAGTGSGEVKIEIANRRDFKDLWNSSAWTIDYWLYIPTGMSSYLYMLRNYASATDYDGIYSVLSPTELYLNMFNGVSSQGYVTYPLSSITKDVWHHVAFERYNGSLRMYIDGVIVATDTAGTINSTDYMFWMFYYTGAGSGLNVRVDEFRISKVARYHGVNFTTKTGEYIVLSPDWEVLADFENESNEPNDVVSKYGTNWTNEVRGGGGNGYNSGIADVDCLNGYHLYTLASAGSPPFCYFRHFVTGKEWYDRISNSIGWTIECRMRAIYSGSTASRNGIVWKDGVWAGVVEFMDSGYQQASYSGQIRVTSEYKEGDTVTYQITSRDYDLAKRGGWADYHKIRITGKLNNVKVYLNDVQIFSFTPKMSEAVEKEVGFGAMGLGASWWDYLKYLTTGAYSPSERP